jgi:hypothetical protein
MSRRSFFSLAYLGLASCAFKPLSRFEGDKIPNLADIPSMRLFAVGQSWRYKKINFFNSLQVDEVLEELVALEPLVTIQRTGRLGSLSPETQTSQGFVLSDPYWDQEPTYALSAPLWPLSFNANSFIDHDTAYRVAGRSFKFWVSIQRKVTGFEKISSSCGTFNTVKVESLIRLNHPDFNRQSYVRKDTLWIAPLIGRWVVRETQGEYVMLSRRPNIGRDDFFRYELTDWT